MAMVDSACLPTGRIFLAEMTLLMPASAIRPAAQTGFSRESWVEVLSKSSFDCLE